MIAPLSVVRHGAGPPVLLLHPLAADHRFWDPVVDHLPGVEVIRPDLPGHGATPVPDAPYTIGDVARAVAGRVCELGLERVDVVGVSLGGLVAQHLAAHEGALVRRLVLANTLPVYPEPLRSGWKERAAVARTRGLEPLLVPTRTAWFTYRAGSEHPGVRYLQRSLLAMNPEGYALACEALAAADLRAVASGIRVPVLAVCGAEEAPAFEAGTAWFEAVLPDVALHVVPQAAHAAVLENAEDFAAAIARFLNR